MGLFNKMVNYVTGGSAVVDVHIEGANLTSPFNVTVSAEIKKQDLNADHVYLLIRCQDVRLAGYVPEDQVSTDNERILQEMNEWTFDTLFKTEVEVSGSDVLHSGKTYTWDVELDLSEAEKVSFDSQGHKIIWEVQAAIDVPGNDPDSGWVEFLVK